MTVESLDTVLSDAADEAERAAPGEGVDAVVWDELISRTGEDSRLSISYQIFLTIACLLAAIGAITDSPVTVVGAMVLGPSSDRSRRRPSAWSCAAATWYAGAHSRWPSVSRWPWPSRLQPRWLSMRPALLSTRTLDSLDQVEFIYDVGPFSFLVAILAGIAGTLALTSAKSASLVGVFISVTTVPAAAFASVALVEGRFDEAASSALQLVINLVGIVVAAALTLLIALRLRRR